MDESITQLDAPKVVGTKSSDLLSPSEPRAPACPAPPWPPPSALLAACCPLLPLHWMEGLKPSVRAFA